MKNKITKNKIGMVVGVLLFLAIIAATLPIPVLGAPGSPSVEIDDASADVGATTTTSFTAYDVVNFSNYGIIVRFDPGVVNITGATFNPAMGSASFESNVSGGYVRIFTLNLGPPFAEFPDQSGDVLLATFDLEAVAPGTSPLNIEFGKMVHTNSTEFTAETINGTFTCTGAPQSINVDLRADGIGGNILDATSYTVNPGTVTEDGVTIDNQTAMGAVIVYCQDNGISVDITNESWGEYLIQIGSDPSDENCWMYAVDAVVPSVGGAQYSLSGEEKVHWFNYNLNYYTVLTELDTTYVEISDYVTATVTWKNMTGTYPLSGATMYETDTAYVAGTSIGTTDIDGNCTFQADETGRWYVYADDPTHGSGIFNLAYYDCGGDVDVLVEVVAPDDCVDGAFTVDIDVDPNGVEVYAAQYDLAFDPSAIQITNMNAGPLLEEGGADTLVVVNTYDNVLGSASFSQTRKGTASGATSAGTLTEIEFVTVGAGGSTSDITLSGVVVSDENADGVASSITHDSVTICVANEPPEAHARSNHKYNNVGTVYLCEAELDGTESTDTDGTIVQYNWAFGDGQYGSGAVARHKYGSYVFSTPNYTSFTATLTVMDDGGLVDDGDCEVIVYIAGDANGDGTVNVLDAAMVGLKWNEAGSPTGVTWPGDEMADRADLNNDRSINILDAVIIGACWGNNA